MLKGAIKDFYVTLLIGDADVLTDIFAGEPVVNTPLHGEVKGTQAFKQFVADQQAWLKQHQAEPELLALTATDERIVAEFVLYLQREDGTIDLPVSIAADLANGGIAAIRVYHSTWPLTGDHVIRPPILEPVEGLEEPEIIQKYMAGIAKPDTGAVLALFADGGYVREPSGSKYKYVGPDGLKTFYSSALSNGGISLRHCTATFDGTRVAVEFICDGWGPVKFEPQAGMAVYELTDSGQLLAARIYDDVSPPSETA
jgi:hypothetical protein